MKTNIVYAERFVEVLLDDLPDGVYEGTWGGYVAEVRIGDNLFHLRTEDGIRTPSTKCVVTVKDGDVTIVAV